MIDSQEFNSILDLINAFPDEQACINHLEKLRWNGVVLSPFDPHSKVYDCKGHQYKCKNTGKYFNVKTGTLFEGTKVSLQKWFIAIYLITSHSKGISSIQLSKNIDVTQKTSWFMLQRIMNCFGIDSKGLDNEVEVDETYIGGKNKNRHYDKKVHNAQGRSIKNKVPVLGIAERGGKVIAKKVQNVNAGTLLPEISHYVKSTAKIYTDEWSAYRGLGRVYANHSFINHGIGEYVRGPVHTNTIEGFWSLLKRGINGIYHYISPKHLQKYLNAYAYRYNMRADSASQKFNSMLSLMKNKLTYNQLVNGC